ncbi:MAG: hypothetical protein IPJ88_05000 [Myxococcales bacterium]|nr:MAG: hypothetical protein IPJ88_05000 [Myxococcales bacterium]
MHARYLLTFALVASTACGRLGYDPSDSPENQSALDSDGDGVPDSLELLQDTDGDGLLNVFDPDDDGDSLPTSVELAQENLLGEDIDSDGLFAYLDLDSDGDGLLDAEELAEDLDGDGIPNFLDTDSDGDGIPDSEDTDTYCSDGRSNFAESDVDCGGGSCPLCSDGASCMNNNDCQSLICGDNKTCMPTGCSDGKRNGDETDVDCGGSCAVCANGKNCQLPEDCSSAMCTGNICQAPSCSDGALNQDETDVDCGGAICGACTDGKSCSIATDCQSSVCTTNICQAPSCSDSALNQDETDVDCGGAICGACTDGKSCSIATDCQSSVCTTNVCQVATCADGTWNQDETDVDCGGSTCGMCTTGQGCSTAGDCDSGVCTGNICQAPTCSDSAQNFDETDVDCGGSVCGNCSTGQSCAIGSDCTSFVCTTNVCQAATCADGVWNQDETTTDCGGSICSPCPPGGACLVGTDCDSGICTSNLCQSPTCSDNLQNQDETDIDCGGSTCLLCADSGASRGWQTATSSPPGRVHSIKLLYHATRNSILAYGGVDQNGNSIASMWEYEGSTWTTICSSCAPGARTEGHGFVYDSWRDRVLLYSDDNASAALWEWDGSVWQQLSDAPVGRNGAYMAFDDTRGRVILFGGKSNSNQAFSTVYEYDGSSWYGPYSPSTRPNTRWDGGSAAAFVNHQALDPALRDKFVIFGGARDFGDPPTTLNDDFWAWDGINQTWTQICNNCTGDARSMAALVYDPASGRVALTGGWIGYTEIAGTWEYQGSWSLSAASTPGARDSSGIAYDAFRNVIVQIGGNGGSCSGPGVYPWDSNCGGTLEFVLQ